MTLCKLNKSIIDCRQCDRLVKFREKIATEKRKQYKKLKNYLRKLNKK